MSTGQILFGVGPVLVLTVGSQALASRLTGPSAPAGRVGPAGGRVCRAVIHPPTGRAR
jgi:hypothetical protein